MPVLPSLLPSSLPLPLLLQLQLQLPVFAVILSEAKDPDALRPPSISSDLSAPPSFRLPSPCPRRTKINLKKMENFSRRICCRFQPRFHHNSTTIYHAKNHVLHAKICKTPCKNALFTPEKEN